MISMAHKMDEKSVAKGILKKSSVSLYEPTTKHVDLATGNIAAASTLPCSSTTTNPVGQSTTVLPRKKAHIKDQNGIWLPGQCQDVDEEKDNVNLATGGGNTSSGVSKRTSVIDKTTGERVAYRLVQQRSLEIDDRRKQGRLRMQKSIDLSHCLSHHRHHENASSNDPVESANAVDTNTTDESFERQDCAEFDSEDDNNSIIRHRIPSGDRLISSVFPTEDRIIQLMCCNATGDESSQEGDNQGQQGPRLSIRDLLAHRVPGLEEDEDEEDEASIERSSAIKS